MKKTIQLSNFIPLHTVQFRWDVINDALFGVRILNCRVIIRYKIALQRIKNMVIEQIREKALVLTQGLKNSKFWEVKNSPMLSYRTVIKSYLDFCYSFSTLFRFWKNPKQIPNQACCVERVGGQGLYGHFNSPYKVTRLGPNG